MKIPTKLAALVTALYGAIAAVSTEFKAPTWAHVAVVAVMTVLAGLLDPQSGKTETWPAVVAAPAPSSPTSTSAPQP